MLCTRNHCESCKLGNFTEVFGFLIPILFLHFISQSTLVLYPKSKESVLADLQQLPLGVTYGQGVEEEGKHEEMNSVFKELLIIH